MTQAPRTITMPDVDDVTIAERLDHLAEAAPDHVLCRYHGRTWTVAAICEAANRVANALLATGLAPGERVALMLPSHPDHIVCILALAKAGLVRVPVNISLIGPALSYPFEAFAPNALVADGAHAAALAPVLAANPGFDPVWWGDAGPAGRQYATLASRADAASPPYPAPDDIGAITPSSGTTGAPKGVLKSDRVLRAGPMSVLRLTEAQSGETFLFWEALHHGAGVAVLYAAIMGRLTLAMQDRFSASRFWTQAKAAGASRIHYLGTVLSMLLRQPATAADRTHGVRMAWGGGCPADLWAEVEQRFGVAIREGYGLSELTTFATLNLDGRPGSVGLPLSWYEAEVMDEQGHPVPPGAQGELCFRPRDRRVGFLGYFRNEAATAEMWRDGWVRTGDLATQDADGYLYFAGRAKDSIRRRGINISAWEVERVIAGHPAVAEVAMVGVPSELGEDEIKLFIRTAEGAALRPRELLAWCHERLPVFQLPRYIEFVHDFPRTPTQRIQKRELPKGVAGSWDAQAQ